MTPEERLDWLIKQIRFEAEYLREAERASQCQTERQLLSDIADDLETLYANTLDARSRDGEHQSVTPHMDYETAVEVARTRIFDQVTRAIEDFEAEVRRASSAAIAKAQS